MGRYTIDVPSDLVNVVRDDKGQTVKENGLKSIARTLARYERILDADNVSAEDRHDALTKQCAVIRTLKDLGFHVYMEYPNDDAIVCIRRN